MALDPISALSIAAAAVQFVQFSCQIVSKGRHIYISSNGNLQENGETEAVTLRLKELTQRLKKSTGTARVKVNPLDPDEIQKHHKQVQDICNECNNLSKTLLDRLYELKVPNGSEHRKWKSFRHALKSVWSKREIDQMSERLRQLRDELDSHLMFLLRETLSGISISQDNLLTLLDKRTREIIQSITGTCNVQKDELQQHFEQFTMSQRQEFERTRAAFVQRDSENRKVRVQVHILESLRFAEMSHRYETIAPAHAKTFRWLFRDPQRFAKPWDSLEEWLSQGSGTYWVQGKAASGKSTLLKFIWRSPETWAYLNDWARGSRLMAGAFYFWNSGVAEQRSQTGLFRSLLYAMLKEGTDLIAAVLPDEWERNCTLAAHDTQLALENWSLGQLQTAFARLVSLATEDFQLCFFIDGLDEYDGSAGDIAEYIHSLSNQYAKFCVSSRPWPVFDDTFRKVPGLKLQDLTKDDIRAYVEDVLGQNKHMQNLQKWDPKNMSGLIEEVVEKAAGVFLWVELVAKSLIQGLRDGDEISHLRCRLFNLPSDLERLYEHMLRRIEPEYKEEASKIFQIFRANGYSLGIPTLHRALLYVDYQQVTNMDFAGRDLVLDDGTVNGNEKMDATLERMVMRLNSRSKGLLEAHEIHDEDQRTEPKQSQALDTCAIASVVQYNEDRRDPLGRALIHEGDQYDERRGNLVRRRIHKRRQHNANRGDSRVILSQPHERFSHPDDVRDAGVKTTLLSDKQHPLLRLMENFDDSSRAGLETTNTDQNTSADACSQKQPSWPQRPPYVAYLHRTVRDFLEQPNVWQGVLDETKHTGFDPHVALIMAYVIEAKMTPLVRMMGPCVYVTGLKLFSWLGGLHIPVASLAAHALIEELDRILTICYTGGASSLANEHWSHSNPRWNDTPDRRHNWGSDILSMAVRCHVNWYLEARLKDVACPMVIAVRQGLPLPYLRSVQRPGLPLLAYALYLDCWAVEGLAVEPDVTMIEKLLAHGQNPNAIYRGYTLWQYTIHYLHILNFIRSKDPNFSAWLNAFTLMLNHGADPHVCCIEDSCAFAQSIALSKEGDIGYSRPVVAEHTFYNTASHPLNIGKRSGDKSFAADALHAQHHSVTAVVHDVFRMRSISGSELLETILEEKKKAAVFHQGSKWKKRRHGNNGFGNGPRWVF